MNGGSLEICPCINAEVVDVLSNPCTLNGQWCSPIASVVDACETPSAEVTALWCNILAAVGVTVTGAWFLDFETAADGTITCQFQANLGAGLVQLTREPLSSCEAVRTCYEAVAVTVAGRSVCE